MQGIEQSHLQASIDAVLNAANALWRLPVSSALRPLNRYGKLDTLMMDGTPEIMIIKTLTKYDEHFIVITEEVGVKEMYSLSRISQGKSPTFIFCDPTDRSTPIKKALEAVEDKTQTVAEAMGSREFQDDWEKKFGGPIAITGGTSAVTCVRRGVPIFSVIINYITRKLFIACSAGCYSYQLEENATTASLETILAKGEEIFFNNIGSNEHMMKFVTFMGKQGYKENFIDSQFMTEADMDRNLQYGLPGGPSRALYLSDIQAVPIGFILANGEKITEWIHWMPYLRFARRKHDQGESALRLFEIYQDRPWTRDGILMSTPPAYSIFKSISPDEKMVINIDMFGSFGNPSQIRSTLILTTADNSWATGVVNQYGYREIKF